MKPTFKLFIAILSLATESFANGGLFSISNKTAPFYLSRLSRIIAALYTLY